MSRLVQARLGFAAGTVMAGIGAGLQWGAGFGLFLVGAVAAASSLLLVDVDEEESD